MILDRVETPDRRVAQRPFATRRKDKAGRIREHFLKRKMGSLPQPARGSMVLEAGSFEQVRDKAVRPGNDPALLPNQSRLGDVVGAGGV